MAGGQAGGEGVQDAHIPGENTEQYPGTVHHLLLLPLHADGHQGEGAAVDGGGLHEGDDVADDLTKWEVAKGKQDGLQIKVSKQ